MTTASLRWVWSSWEGLSRESLYAAMQLRQEVFVVEQDCPYLDADGLDLQAQHLFGWSSEGQLHAYLRVFPPGRLREEWVIGRVVVSPSRRGEGLGRALMLEAHRLLRARPEPLFLSGQSYLRSFYEALGYEVCGEEYLEDGIPHLPMRRSGAAALSPDSTAG